MELTSKEIERFWSGVKKSEGCWEWQRSVVQKRGYGQILFRKKMFLTHRLAYTLTKGEIPKGKIVCHSCDNRKCCNPDHLWLGTQQDNLLDMMRKHRGAGRNGHATNTKLCAEDVKAIRAFSKEGLSQYEIADKFGVWQSTIGQILHHKTWSWV